MTLTSQFSAPPAIARAPSVSRVRTKLRLQVAVSGQRSKPSISVELKSRPARLGGGGRTPQKRFKKDTENDDTFFQDFLREAEVVLEDISERPGGTLQSMKTLASLPRRSIDERSAQQAVNTITRTLEYGIHVRKKTLLLSHLGKAFQALPALQKCAHQSPEFKQHLTKLFSVAAADPDLYSDMRWVSQLATAQVKLRYYSTDVWERYERSGLHGLSPQAFCDVVYSAAKLHVTVDAPQPSAVLRQHIWDALRQSEDGASLLSDTDPQAVSNTLWALAKLQLRIPDDAQSTLEANVVGAGRSMNSQDVANTSWALAKLGLDMQPATNSVLQQVTIRVSPSMNAQAAANTWWAYAKMGIDVHPETNSALQQAVIRVVPTMKAQEVANTAWAFSKMGADVQPETNSALQKAITRVAPVMDAQNVANTSWAFAKMGVDVQPATNSALQQTVAQVAPVMDAQNAANTWWAFAKMGIAIRPAVNSALQQAIARTVPIMKAEELASTWWAYAERQVKLPDKLVDDLLVATQACAATLDAGQVSRIKQAVSSLGLAARAASDETWQSTKLRF